MISLVQVYWKIKGFRGNERIQVAKGSDLIICRTDDILNEAEDYIDASGQGAITNVISKKTKEVVFSGFEGAYWSFDNVDDFEVIDEKELRCFMSWEEAFSDKYYGKAIKKLYDEKALSYDAIKYLST